MLTIAQLANRLQVSTLTVRRMWYAGELPPPERLGKRSIRWHEDVINQWLAARCPRVTRQPSLEDLLPASHKKQEQHA